MTKSEGLMLQFPSAALGLGASMLNLSKHHLQREYYYDLIQQLIGKHTLKIWSLMCSFVLFTGALAAVGLLDPGYDPADAQHNTSAPGLAVEPLQSSPGNFQRRAKTWKIAVLLLASTVSSGAIAYHLKYADWSPKPSDRPRARAKVKRKGPLERKRASPTAPSKAPSSRNSSPRRAARRPTSTPRSPQLSPPRKTRPRLAPAASTSRRATALPATARLQPTVGQNLKGSSHPTKPQIAVVPDQTAIPLDRREPSLAEVLDLRKRYPMTSIMGKTKEI